MGARNAFWAKVRYTPVTPPCCLRYLRACSSDQKKTDLRQKSSMILGALSRVKSTMGTRKTGSLLRSASVKLRSWRMVNRMGFLQQAHSDSMSNERGSSLSFPCTRGAATASVPQAAQSLSPLEKASLWGVGSAVIG
jgi:hypothetical protein